MDLRFAIRSLWKNPGFTILAVLVMALGIGANTAVFSVVNTVLLKPLAYRDPERIVTLSSGAAHGQVSGPDFHDWHEQSSSFSAMSYYFADPDTPVMAGATAEYGNAAAAGPEFFRVFGVEPSLGRVFSAEEEKPGGERVALISDAYWRSHFGSDPNINGRTIRMEGHALPIVGVLPRGFHFPDKTNIWYPAQQDLEQVDRTAHNYRAIGRLRPGVRLEQAQAEMTGIAARLGQLYRDDRNKPVLVTPMRDEMVGDVRTTLYLLLGAVSLVLLIACANVANLLLAKATARGREIAVRSAIGASRGRIVRQLVTESMVLALASGIAGLALALIGSNALVALAPKDVPRLADTSIDGWVLAFTLGVSGLASLLFGLAPALQASRVDLNEALKQGAGRVAGLSGSGRIRSVLVIAEIALSVVLLTGAGLLMKSFLALNNVELGFRTEKVLVMGSSVPSTNLRESIRATRFYKDFLADAKTIPGVVAAGATRATPGHVSSWGGYVIDNLPAPGQRRARGPQAVFSVVAPGTFTALGIPLHRGRDFNDGDTYDAKFTAVINEALAKQAFPGEDPIGRQIFCGLDSMNAMTIVGIVGDIRQYGPANKPSPEIYMPYEQHPRRSTSLNVVVRTANDPFAAAETLRRKARERSPEVPVKFTTMEASLAENVAAPRFRTMLLGLFAGLAVTLAMAGVYGVMSCVVGQRAAEIGLRMALGATPGKVMAMVLRQGLIMAGIGLTIGLGGALAATRVLTTMLFEVKPGDAATYVAVTLLLGLVAMAASYFPARRATRVDPLSALRQD